ncbi:MAG: CoA-binding protein [Actinomycetota bacterium]
MTISGMDTFFNPRGVALVGARSTPGFGFGIPLVLRREGWDDRLYLVNPRGGELHGYGVYEDVAGVPDPVDLAIVVVPAPSVPGVLEEVADRGIRHVIIESAGFAEVGDDGIALQEAAREVAARRGMRIIGPNCVGVVNTSNHFTSVEVIEEAMLRGTTSIIAQSGVFGAVMLDMLFQYGLHVSKAVTLGNRMDVDECDMLDYLAGDEATRSIMMYLEGARDGRRLKETLGRVASGKPVLILKSGRSEAGRQATASHTASLSGEDEIYEAVFRQTAAVRAGSLEELVEMTRVFSTQPMPRGSRLGIVTSSGSLGVLATDAAAECGLEVPPLSEGSADRVAEAAPGWMNVRNPVDVGPSPQFPVALEALLDDPGVDMVLGIAVLPYFIFREVTSRGSTGHNWFGDVAAIRERHPGKPFAICAVGHSDFVDRVRELSGPLVPVFVSPEPAVRALAALTRNRPIST